MFNVCMCGAGAGYPHDVDCPRPLFRGSDAMQDAWRSERDANRKTREDRDRLVSMWDHVEWCYVRAEACRANGCEDEAEGYERGIDAELAAIEQLQGECRYVRGELLVIVDDVPAGWDHV